MDLLLGVGREDIDSVLTALKKIGCRPKRQPPLHLVGDHSFVQLLYTPPEEFYEVQLDLLLAETPLEKSALDRSVSRSVDGIDNPIQVLACEDLILFKLVSGRMIDRADAAMLLRENFAELDIRYLGDWIGRLDLRNELKEIWTEAFPSRELPDLPG